MPSYHVVPDPATNSVGTTDANGNASGYTYDVENRIAVGPASMFSAGGYQYGYAPGDKRVWKAVCCVTDPNTGNQVPSEEIAFWSVTGQKLGTYRLSASAGQVSPQLIQPTFTASQLATNYYFGGKLIKNAKGYVGADRLGSIGKYYPYGQEKPSATQNGTEKFGTYFRDSETGLDYAVNRYYPPGTGRFLTPDPYQPSAEAHEPGNWN